MKNTQTQTENLFKLYLKETFSVEDTERIGNAIENRELFTDDIKEDCMDYIYERMETEGIDDVDEIEIWKYTDENLSNGLTHEENYHNLINYLKENFLIA